MSSTTHIPLPAVRSHAEALENWRAAEELVAVRWQLFIEADGASRRRAFASYLAALDAEEAAASELASLSPSAIAA